MEVVVCVLLAVSRAKGGRSSREKRTNLTPNVRMVSSVRVIGSYYYGVKAAGGKRK